MKLTRATSLRDQVCVAVLDLIRSGELALGARVTEEALAERFDVSRTPIREALARLAQNGILQKRTQGGYFIPNLQEQQVSDLFAVRTLLECAAVGLACETLTDKCLQELDIAFRGQVEATEKLDAQKFEFHNDKFRATLFGNIPNALLKKYVGEFDAHIHFMRGIAEMDPESLGQMMNRQKAFIDALKSRDKDAAEARWKEYLARSEEWLLKSLVDANARAETLKESAAAADA